MIQRYMYFIRLSLRLDSILRISGEGDSAYELVKNGDDEYILPSTGIAGVIKNYVQAEYPECEVYFLTGSDKLHILPRWHRINEFIEKFKVLVARRGEDNLDLIKAANPFLVKHWEAFVSFDIPDDIKDISSSAFRKKLRSGDMSAQDLVTPEVWKIL